jgi:hypothetical protein
MDASLDPVHALIFSGEIEEDEAVLRDLLQKWNHSFLAHGLMPVGGNTEHKCSEYVDGIVEASEPRIGAEHARLRNL